MLISHEHKFIFIHVPRAAGTSIEKSLATTIGIDNYALHNGTPEEHLMPADLLSPDFDRTKEIRGMKHASAVEVRAFVGEEIWNSYFKFAVVRCPLDRTVSVYLKTIKKSKSQLLRSFGKSKIAFQTSIFLKYGILRRSPELQRSYVCDEDGNILMDDFIRFENLDNDYLRICRRLGLESELLNNQDGTRANGESKSYYGPITRRLISNAKRKDLQAFGYTS